MDEITRLVDEMYTKYPYPSPKAGGRQLRELQNLLKLFSIETQYDFQGKRILDAGTGTGHRLIEAAKAFTQTRFLAVDISDIPLEIARQTLNTEGITNVEIRKFNLMEKGAALGTFDVILSMGVIHHLSDPAGGLHNLVRNLSDDGILFVYIYGRHGGRERMRRKAIVSMLLGDRRGDLDEGIQLVKKLGFDKFDYGWNLNFDDEISRDGLIVDALLNVNENLYAINEICDLMRNSGLHGFMTYGVSLDKRGCLFDTRYGPDGRKMLETTDIATRLGPDAREAYERLNLLDKYRLLDLYFEPNGYTLMGFKPGALCHFAPDSRIVANTILVADL